MKIDLNNSIPFEKGVYSAHTSSNGPMIIREEYELYNHENKFILKSNITVFGNNGFYQEVFMELNEDWSPSSIIIDSPGNVNFTAQFHNNQAVFTSQLPGETSTTQSVPILNEKFFFAFNGALVIPFLWLRCLNPDSKKINFQILPIGYAEVEVLENTTISDKVFNKLQLKQFVNDLETIFIVTYDFNGVLHSVNNNNLIIRKNDA